jgi:hypothetical protein
MPTREPLPPDEESVEKWRAMPQNKPSRDALPPMTGGLQVNRALLIGIGIVAVVITIASLLNGR